MMTDKIESEQIVADQIRTGQSAKRVTRIGGFTGNIEQIINAPFGYGANPDLNEEHSMLQSGNGLIDLLKMWGISILIIILACSYNVIRRLKVLWDVNINTFHTVLLILIIILPITGNPFYNQPFLFSILLSGFIVISRNKELWYAHKT
jgi:hypothetical protein